MDKWTIENVRNAVGQGAIPTRHQICDRMGRKKTTHAIATIEKAVKAGVIVKMAGYCQGRSCWRYALPSSAIGMFILDADVEPDLVAPAARSEVYAINESLDELDWMNKDWSFNEWTPEDKDEYGYLVMEKRKLGAALDILAS